VGKGPRGFDKSDRNPYLRQVFPVQFDGDSDPGVSGLVWIDPVTRGGNL
jgi:hypothetical protein